MLTSDIFKILRKQSAGINGEIQRADASNVQVENGGVEAVTLVGSRFDCGNVRGYIDATMHVAKKLALI